MRSVIEELYNGRIYPAEQIVPDSQEYKQLNQKISNQKKELRERLPDYDVKLLEALYNDLYDQGNMLDTETFISGFTLGALLMMEVTRCMEDM